NDVGLLSEEYDTKAKRQCGNFPQAFSHVALVNAGLAISGDTTEEQGIPNLSPTGEGEELP
ncbi:glycoside hydrolase family 15 protein, partial [Caballeronia arvi]|uniref:glycoside hydrolase family 15 protein n=1 Tax=Caballeronia arvi TaxID=1777135 RepID=UPI000B10CB1F